MTPAAPLLDALRAGNHLPWGLSCLCFSLDGGGGSASVLDYLAHRQVPAILFLARPGGGGAQAAARPLEDILLEERAG